MSAEDAVKGVAEKLGDKALQYLSSFEELAKQYSPDVVDAGLTVIQVHGVKSLVESLAAIFIGAAMCFFAYKLYPIIEEKVEDIVAFLFTAVSGLVGCAVFVLGAIAILNVWMWVAIFNPKLYLAYKIFGKLF